MKKFPLRRASSRTAAPGERDARVCLRTAQTAACCAPQRVLYDRARLRDYVATRQLLASMTMGPSAAALQAHAHNAEDENAECDDLADWYCSLSIALDGLSLDIEESFEEHSESSSDRTGDCVWDCALHLCAHLCLMRRRQHEGWDPAGKRVLELGSGTGAVGLALAKLGALPIITDRHIELIQRNVARHSLASGTPIRVAALDWASGADGLSAIDVEPCEIDWIVASDVIYPTVPANDLAQLLGHSIRVNPRVCVLLAYEQRTAPATGPDHSVLFFEHLAPADGLRLTRVSEEDLITEAVRTLPRLSTSSIGHKADVQLWRHSPH